MLNPEDEAEIAALSRKYGSPERHVCHYRVRTERDARWSAGLNNRRGEVILIAPRPGRRILLHTKSFYPAATFRLPSGGVHHGESIEAAARREAHEELGFDLQVARFLAVIENHFLADDSDVTFPSFVLLLEQSSGAPRVMDPDEQITEFREVGEDKLREVARALSIMAPDWEMWGKFRALPHALLADWLARERAAG